MTYNPIVHVHWSVPFVSVSKLIIKPFLLFRVKYLLLMEALQNLPSLVHHKEKVRLKALNTCE